MAHTAACRTCIFRSTWTLSPLTTALTQSSTLRVSSNNHSPSHLPSHHYFRKTLSQPHMPTRRCLGHNTLYLYTHHMARTPPFHRPSQHHNPYLTIVHSSSATTKQANSSNHNKCSLLVRTNSHPWAWQAQCQVRSTSSLTWSKTSVDQAMGHHHPSRTLASTCKM